MSDAADMALRFLRNVEDRELDAAEELLAEDAHFVYPPGVGYDDLRRCVEDRSTRYRRVGKDIETVHEAHDGDRVHVYVSGTLHGVANDGSSIEGIRFVDRLTVADGRIVAHDVWNDLSP